jgi:hypothetical protein
MTHQMLIALAVLAGIGVLAIAGRTVRAGRRAAQQARRTGLIAGGLLRVLLTTAALTGAEWAVIVRVHDWRVVLIALAVPSLLAACTVARMFTVTEVVPARGWRR